MLKKQANMLEVAMDVSIMGKDNYRKPIPFLLSNASSIPFWTDIIEMYKRLVAEDSSVVGFDDISQDDYDVYVDYNRTNDNNNIKNDIIVVNMDYKEGDGTHNFHSLIPINIQVNDETEESMGVLRNILIIPKCYLWGGDDESVVEFFRYSSSAAIGRWFYNSRSTSNNLRIVDLTKRCHYDLGVLTYLIICDKYVDGPAISREDGKWTPIENEDLMTYLEYLCKKNIRAEEAYNNLFDDYYNHNLKRNLLLECW